MITIPQAYVNATCKLGCGASTCRYLVVGSHGFMCGKINAALKANIDERVVDGKIGSVVDNCSGWNSSLIRIRGTRDLA